MLWKDVFWSRNYSLLTTEGAPIQTIRKYIQSQRQQLMKTVENRKEV